MTHTLHRQGSEKELSNDYVLLSMAASGFNDKEAAAKLIDNFKLMIEENPVNYGDDNRGGILNGLTADEIIEKANNKAYMGAVYSTKRDLKNVLKKLKEADNGMSVVVSGNFKEIFEVLKELNISPNSVHLSLGIHGKTDLLPEKEILEITTMCGHGMVTPERVKQMVEKVCSGKMTAEKAANRLAYTCTCGVFNPKRAENIIKKICKEKRK